LPLLAADAQSLEEENAALIRANATLESDLQKAGASKTLVDNYKSQIESLEKKANEQATQVSMPRTSRLMRRYQN
jgi:protein HOOK3